MQSFDSEVVEQSGMDSFESEIDETASWFASPRFKGIIRLYSARQVVEQQGTLHRLHGRPKGRGSFLPRLRELFERKSITTFGPYSPGQAVPSSVWESKASIWAAGRHRRREHHRRPGADLASYP